MTLRIQVQSYGVFTKIINLRSVSPSLPLKTSVLDFHVSTPLLLFYPLLNMQQAQNNNCNITINNIVVVCRVKLLCSKVTRCSSLCCFVTNWIQKLLYFRFVPPLHFKFCFIIIYDILHGFKAKYIKQDIFLKV